MPGPRKQNCIGLSITVATVDATASVAVEPVSLLFVSVRLLFAVAAALYFDVNCYEWGFTCSCGLTPSYKHCC